MIDSAIDISYKTFMKHVDRSDLISIFPSYQWKRSYQWDEHGFETGLWLKNDWAVKFQRSKFKEKCVYILVHSGIEYIFVKN